MRQLGTTQPSLSSRVLYPFALASVRANAEIKASPGSTSARARPGASSKNPRARSGDGSIGGFEVKDVNEEWRKKLRGNRMTGWGLDDDDEEEGGGKEEGGSSGVSAGSSVGSSSVSGIDDRRFAETDLRLSRLLQACMQEDIKADRVHALSGAGNTPYQYNISIHPIDIHLLTTQHLHATYQHTLSVHPFNAPYQLTVSIYPLKPSSQHNFSHIFVCDRR